MKKLNELFTGAVAENVQHALSLGGAWRAVVGETMAGISAPLKLDGTQLVVGVTDSVWMSEIGFLKDDIINRLKEHGANITDIRFVFLPKKIKRKEPPVRKRTITEKEQGFIDRLSSTIDDDTLRESYRAALTAYFTVHDLNEFLSSQ